MQKKIIVTGGAGFIGSALVRCLVSKTENKIINIDKLTYAGNLENLEEVKDNERYTFIRADICNRNKITEIFETFKPDLVVHLAAESHVDRSIDGAADFINTNIIGTFNLLESALAHWKSLPANDKNDFRFLHVSTDEVYGSLGSQGFFTEDTSYDPSSPYSASKASSDHLVRAWQRTYGLPTIVTNCSNNYGPYQFPEKLIPVVILNALKGNSIPVYGKGENVRDWLYVEDHIDALMTVLFSGKPGETYNIGGHNEVKNIEIVNIICGIMNEVSPPADGKDYKDLITFVKDRPGHDMRYAIDASKIAGELGWTPSYNFEEGIRKTVNWYLHNLDWCAAVMQNKYNLERLGNNEDK